MQSFFGGKIPAAAATAFALIALGSSKAPRAADAPAAPSLTDVLASSGISASGYVAASFYHSNGYPGNIHQFDVEHDSFQLDQAGLTIAYQPKEGFGALVDVIAGEDARLLHQAEDGNDNTVDVKQAFVQYATGSLTVMAGKFLTLAGAEVIAPTGNTNFSRSLLFFASEPLTHTGLRATYAVNSMFSVTGGINNGWNTTSTSYGSKTAEVGVGFTPSKAFSLLATGYFGKAEQYDAEKSLVDVVATYNATDALTFVLNYDWDQQKFPDAFEVSDASWSGIAAYVNYAINSQMRVSVRAEYLDDKDGFLTGTEQKLKEGTITFGYSPAKNFELRIEGRYDKAGNNLFLRSIQRSSETETFGDSLGQFALQGVYKFGG